MARTFFFALLLIGCGGRSSDDAPSSTSAEDAAGGTGGVLVGAGAAGATLDPTVKPATGGMGASAMQGSLLRLSPAQVEDLKTNACNAWAVESERVNFNLVWLIDSSSSRDAARDWKLTISDVIEAIDDTYATLGCTNARTYVQLFPGTVSDQPAVPEVLGPAQCLDTTLAEVISSNTPHPPTGLEQLRQRLETAIPIGGTPTLDAYRSFVTGYDWELVTHTWQPSLVILVTDGMASVDEECNAENPPDEAQFWSGVAGPDRRMASTDAIIQEVAAASARGIRTLVMATPESESAAQGWLSRAAIAGGADTTQCDPNGGEPYCHARMGQGVRLSQTILEYLGEGSDPLRPCTHVFPATSADGTLVVNLEKTTPLIYDGNGDVWLATHHTAASECLHGFLQLDESTLQLCEATCQMLRQDCEARPVFLFGCSGGPLETLL